MSTRANIIIRDGYDELIFYRHCDGYPEGTLPSLETFLSFVKTGKIRDNVGQASGWLIVLGQKEYNRSLVDGQPPHWEVGAYEPTTGIHGDIEYLYVVDLTDQKIYIDGKDGFTYKGKYDENRQ